MFLCTKGTKGTISASGRHDTTRFFFARKARMIRFPQAEGTIHSSCHSCTKYRAVDLSTSYPSCYSCHEESCRRPVDIVSFVLFVQEEIVSSTCRHRIIRVLRAQKIVLSTCRYRAIRAIRASLKATASSTICE